MNTRAAIALTALLVPCSAHADPPPKVCVAVVGDPDEAVRALAEDVTARISTSGELRGVADADSRAALRGEPSAPASDLTAARRGLRGTDADLDPLRALADQLGCAWFVELGARPAGTLVRVIDVVRRAERAAETRASVDAAEVVALVQRMSTSPLVPAASTPDAGASPTGPTDGGAGADASADGGAPLALATDAGTVSRAAAATTPARAERPLIARIWPWLLVGGLAFAGAAVAILLAPEPETSTRLTVIHTGTP